MASKLRALSLALIAAAGVVMIAGCGEKEEAYKIEGPTAEGNPSVAGAATAGGGAATKPKPGETPSGLPPDERPVRGGN